MNREKIGIFEIFLIRLFLASEPITKTQMQKDILKIYQDLQMNENAEIEGITPIEKNNEVYILEFQDTVMLARDLNLLIDDDMLALSEYGKITLQKYIKKSATLQELKNKISAKI